MHLTKKNPATIRQFIPSFSQGLFSLGFGLSLLAPAFSNASEIATNILLSFNETADFSLGIDKLITLDATKLDARVLNTRLGTLSGGNVVFTMNANHSVSINDPGVPALPDERRDFFRVSGNATASSTLLPEPVSLNMGTIWHCANTVLKCNDNEVFGVGKSSTQTFNLPADKASLLTPIHVQSGITVTPLAQPYTLNFIKLHADGSLQVNAIYTAKTATQYVADALAATSGSTGNGRWGAAASDIHALRNGSWTDVAVGKELQASHTPELEAAHRLLSIARDSATILSSGNTPPASFNTSFKLTQHLWNLAATAEPSLGRNLAGSTSEAFSTQDLATEVAVLRTLLNGSDDASFTAGVEGLLNSGLTTGSAPVLSFDGALLGLDGATMSVFYVGDSSGRVEVDLAAADRYAFWRTAYTFDRLAFIDGAAKGLTVIGGNYDGTQIGLGEETTVVGESDIFHDGLFMLSGNQAATRLQLNNLYSNQLLVVATWGVTPVPEPAIYSLLLFGLVLIGRIKKLA